MSSRSTSRLPGSHSYQCCLLLLLLVLLLCNPAVLFVDIAHMLVVAHVSCSLHGFSGTACCACAQSQNPYYTQSTAQMLLSGLLCYLTLLFGLLPSSHSTAGLTVELEAQ